MNKKLALITLRVSIIFIPFYHVYSQSSYDVGSTGINVGVGQIGNSTATLPVYCPPGRLGITPRINITYNSQAGNSVLGKGWNLSVVSAINRTGNNYHLDHGIQEGITLNQSDKFNLDGQRLLLVQGNYGDLNSIYRTETDQFAQITFKGNYFEVDGKDGGKLFYGKANNSSLIPAGSSVTLAWYLYRSYDRLGNFIEYIYDMTNGQILLQEIRYTGFDCSKNGTVNCGITPESSFNKIVFTYEITPNINEQYVAGYKLRQNKRLVKIESFADLTTKVRECSFTYMSDEINSYLTTIQEKNGSSQQLHPVNLIWTEDGQTQRNTGIVQCDYTHLRLTGDFDGDGKTELLVIGRELNPMNEKFLDKGTSYKIIKCNTSAFGSSLMGNGNLPCDHISAVMVGDVDADGDDDIIFQTLDLSYNYSKTDFDICPDINRYTINNMTYHYNALRSKLSQHNVLGFDYVANIYPSRQVINSVPGSLTSKVQLYQYSLVIPALVEADGDGLPDLLERETWGDRIVAHSTACGDVDQTTVNPETHNNIHLYLSTLRNSTYKYYDYPSTLPKMAHYIPMDFNGNGKTDFLHTFSDNDRSEIMEYDNVAKTFKHLYGNGSNQFPTQYHTYLQTADFNGDGKTDLLYFVNANWYVAYSNGLGFDEYNATNLWFQHNYNIGWCQTGFALEIGDFNGDGRDDIIERHDHPHATYLNHGADALFVYYSKGFGFKKTGMGTNSHLSSYPYQISKNIVADYDGDGKKDVLLISYITGLYWQSALTESFKQSGFKLNRIENTDKKSYEFSYAPLCNSDHYQKTFIPGKDQAICISPALYIVETMKTKVTGVLDKTFSYYYSDLLFHRHGRGIMGFMQIGTIELNPDQNKTSTVINQYDQNSEYLFKLDLMSTTTYRKGIAHKNSFITAEDEISKTVNSYSQLHTTRLNPNIYFSYVNYMEETNSLTGVRKITCFVYDENGNLIHTQANYDKMNNTQNPEYTNTNDYKYVTFGSWLPSSLIISRNCQQRFNGATPLTPYYTQTQMSYNTKGNLLSTEHFSNNLQYYYKELFLYDNYGNLVKSSLDSANNYNAYTFRSKIYTYANGRFISKISNALNQETLLNYEHLYGNKTSETDAGGLTTSYLYDGWGKLIMTTYPDGNFERLSLSWFSGSNNEDYRITRTDNLGGTTIGYYDALNRKIQEDHIGFAGATERNKWIYDDEKLLQSSNTFNANDPSGLKWSEYTYDYYQRLLTVSYDGVLLTSNNYNLSTTTITNGKGRSKSTTTDATGLTSQSTDPGGTITYRYGSHNKLLRTTVNGSNVNVNYNVQLNKIGLNDQDAGQTLYDYNAFGEIIAQQDARGNIYFMAYDDLGRLTKKWDGNKVSYVYTYFSVIGDPAINKLKSEEYIVSGTTIHKKEYTYNHLGQLKAIIETAANGIKYLTAYSYDSHARLSTIQYPNISIQYSYDNYNNLNKISNTRTGNILWAKLEQNPDGNIKSELFGNNYITRYEYDNHLQLSNISSCNGNNMYILNIAYEFELETGNLKKRTQYMNNQAESFTYDQLDRLVGVDELVNSITTHKTYTMASNGNIIAKNDGGISTYSYDNQKIHAITDHKYLTSLSPAIIPLSSCENHNYTYTPFGKVAAINQEFKTLTLEYGVDQERIIMKTSDYRTIPTTNKTTYYISSANMEVTEGEEITYLYVQGKPFGIHSKSNDQVYFLHLDHQKSILAISDEHGNIIEGHSYDAWGRPRDPYTWDYISSSPFGSGSITARGYTFQEHLEMFSLINMNGRMYDPVLGRMLSPDKYIQQPDNTQSFNRYSYCINNPLKYTDPSGNVFGVDDAVIIMSAAIIYSAYEGGRATNNGNPNPAKWNYSSSCTYAGIIGGGLAGAAAYGVGSYLYMGGASLTANIIITSSISSTGMSFATGGKTPLSTSFGFASLNWNSGEIGFLGKPGISTAENIGYGLGALGNLSDVSNVVDDYTHWEDKLAQKSKNYMDKWTEEHPEATVDPASVGGNIRRSFPSYLNKNPKWCNPMGDAEDYMGMVKNWGWKEYAGYLHDAEYIEKGIQNGAKYLFASYSTYGADLRLMARTLYLGLKHDSPLEIGVGGILTTTNSTKTLYGWTVK